MGKHLVLVGGGHAHMVTLANLYQFIEKGHRVTVIGPSENHYYSGMGPGMLGKTYTPDDIRFATRHVVEKHGGVFVLAKAVGVDPDNKTVQFDSGADISYDVVSFNCGSYVPKPDIVGQNTDIFAVKPIEKLLEAQQRILSLAAKGKTVIGIIGGGPSAIEIAGNIWGLADKQNLRVPAIKLFTRGQLMDRFPDAIRKKAFQSLSRRGITIHENSTVASIENNQITLDSGQNHAADLIFLALGVKPSPIFADSGLPVGPDGGLSVNQFLQSTKYPDIFGGGDCIHYHPQPLDKVGVYAVRENPVLFKNLMATLDGNSLEPFDPGGPYLLIFNLGGGTGILRKNWLQFGGRPAFIIKDYIDRKFMREFQAIE